MLTSEGSPLVPQPLTACNDAAWADGVLTNASAPARPARLERRKVTSELRRLGLGARDAYQRGRSDRHTRRNVGGRPIPSHELRLIPNLTTPADVVTRSRSAHNRSRAERVNIGSTPRTAGHSIRCQRSTAR